MIPVSKPILARNAKKYLLECISSGWISSKGPYITKFEKAFANYIGVRFAITTVSGTSALHLALSCLNIGKGDEVIVPTFTMISPVFAILYTGAKPIFVDSEAETWNIDISQIEKNITKNTKAIIVVHTYGHPADLTSLKKLAKKYKLYLIEDAAEALGSKYQNIMVGSFGDLACFSFYANKTVTTGEGGMVVTNHQQLANKLLSLKDMAHSKTKRFLHTDLAFTYRMTNLQAALGLSQLEIINQVIEKKRSIAKFYNQRLGNIKGLALPSEKFWAKNIYWVYGILANKKDKIRSQLLEKGVDTRDFFIPMHRQPVIIKLGLINSKKHYPVADNLSNMGLYIPSGPDITKNELDKICQALEDSL